MNIVFAEPIGLNNLQKETFVSEMNELGHVVSYYDKSPTDQEELLKRSLDADLLVVSNYKVSEDVILKSTNLKMIAVAFTGTDHIPIDLCRSRGILVCNAAGYSTQAVAELTISMTISLLRKIVVLDKTTRMSDTRNGFLGSELSGKTFGVIGFGSIGGRVAKLANAFGCKVIAWSRTNKNILDVEFVKLDNLLMSSDIVSLHLPLTPSTQALINGSKLKLMKPSSILINTARGGIIDSKDLASALKTGTIGGAAIDVYEYEPPIEKNHPLFSAPNTILLPHIGFATQEAIYNRSEIVLCNIRAWINDEPINIVL